MKEGVKMLLEGYVCADGAKADEDLKQELMKILS
jgi:hypothetical protein